jgi:hypothetical protein
MSGKKTAIITGCLSGEPTVRDLIDAYVPET